MYLSSSPLTCLVLALCPVEYTDHSHLCSGTVSLLSSPSAHFLPLAFTRFRWGLAEGLSIHSLPEHALEAPSALCDIIKVTSSDLGCSGTMCLQYGIAILFLSVNGSLDCIDFLSSSNCIDFPCSPQPKPYYQIGEGISIRVQGRHLEYTTSLVTKLKSVASHFSTSTTITMRPPQPSKPRHRNPTLWSRIRRIHMLF